MRRRLWTRAGRRRTGGVPLGMGVVTIRCRRFFLWFECFETSQCLGDGFYIVELNLRVELKSCPIVQYRYRS